MQEVMDKSVLKALGADTRQSIVKLLSQRPYTATELSKLLGKHVTTIAEHLDVLEKSGIVTKKEGSNKWIYYILSDKGERLFKPRIYSWVVVLSLSAVAFAGGLYQMFSVFSASRASAMMRAAEKAEVVAGAEAAATETGSIEISIIIGILLLILAMIGFYIAWRKKK